MSDVEVPGARLNYDVRGHGSLLIIVPREPWAGDATSYLAMSNEPANPISWPLATAMLLLLAVLGMTACASRSSSGSPSTSAEPSTSTTTTADATTTNPPGTPPPAGRTTPPNTQPPTTQPTTTVTTALSAAAANTGLCQAIQSADQAIQQGKLVAGGLRLGSGIARYSNSADPGLVASAKSALSRGVKGDTSGYVAARDQAAQACARLGIAIIVGGVQCIRAPCPAAFSPLTSDTKARTTPGWT